MSITYLFIMYFCRILLAKAMVSTIGKYRFNNNNNNNNISNFNWPKGSFQILCLILSEFKWTN